MPRTPNHKTSLHPFMDFFFSRGESGLFRDIGQRTWRKKEKAERAPPEICGTCSTFRALSGGQRDRRAGPHCRASLPGLAALSGVGSGLLATMKLQETTRLKQKVSLKDQENSQAAHSGVSSTGRDSPTAWLRHGWETPGDL